MDSKNQNRRPAQQRLAGWLGRSLERLPANGRITIWVLLCLAMTGFSGYLIWSGITGKTPAALTVTSIRVPAHTTQTAEFGHSSIGEQEYNRIHRFKTYMDSLARSPSGRPLYDSLLHARPGLMDSIAIAENLYGSQHK